MFSPFFSLSLLVGIQIRGRVAGSPPPPQYGSCLALLSREDLSLFSPRQLASNNTLTVLQASDTDHRTALRCSARHSAAHMLFETPRDNQKRNTVFRPWRRFSLRQRALHRAHFEVTTRRRLLPCYLNFEADTSGWNNSQHNNGSRYSVRLCALFCCICFFSWGVLPIQSYCSLSCDTDSTIARS